MDREQADFRIICDAVEGLGGKPAPAPRVCGLAGMQAACAQCGAAAMADLASFG